LDSLIKWLDDNPGKRIVTDIKKRNIEGLAAVAIKYPAYIDKFIPQIYKPEQYASAYDLGYKDIIFTLYKYRKDDKRILQGTKNKDIYAITMPKKKAKNTDLVKLLKAERGLKIYAHTVNSTDELKILKDRGVDEIYTDILSKK
jgi:glycerophosphoryl diester phosphodiesterase